MKKKHTPAGTLTVSSVYELLQHDEEDFLKIAYRTLLGRAPDTSGMQHYLARLKSGIPKSLVVYDLCRSQEGRKRDTAKIEGLNDLLKREQRSRWPVLNLFSSRAQSYLDQPHMTNRKLEELRDDMTSLTQTLIAKFDSLERHFTALSNEFRSQHLERVLRSFDSTQYLAKRPDVAEAGINPFEHFVRFGWSEKTIDDHRSQSTPEQPLSSNCHEAPHNDFTLKQLISGIFDEDAYLQRYHDVRDAGLNPLDHFCDHGVHEGRDCTLRFNHAYYRNNNTDLGGMDPLIHYLNKGIYDGRHAYDKHKIERNYLQLNRLVHRLETNVKKLAVHVHAYYVEGITGLTAQLSHIPFEFDLYITTDSHEKAKLLFDTFGIIKNIKQIKPIIVQNRGRDIAPLYIELANLIHEYDIALHVHNKKSVTKGSFGESWAKGIFSSLLGSKLNVMNIVGEFSDNVHLGVVVPAVPEELDPFLTWGDNKEIARSIRKDIHFDPKWLSFDSMYFPCGNMFWFRPKALAPLFGAFTYDDFPPEPIPLDGTLAHTLERLVIPVAEAGGFTYATCQNGTDETAVRTSALGHIPLLDIYRDSNVLRANLAALESTKSVLNSDQDARKPGLSVCIVTKDHPEYIIPLVEYIAREKLLFLRNGLLLEACICDTGSSDIEVLDFYQTCNRDVTLIKDGYQFSRNNNLLALKSQCDHLLFLNNDVRFSSEGQLLNAFMTFIELHEKGIEVGALGCVMHYEADTPSHPPAIQHMGVAFFDKSEIRGLPYHVNHRKVTSNSDIPAIDAYPAVTGAFLMVSSKLFSDVGGFDEGYEKECQDVALALELLKVGKRNYVANIGHVTHFENGTRPKGDEFWADRRRFLRQYMQYIEVAVLSKK